MRDRVWKTLLLLGCLLIMMTGWIWRYSGLLYNIQTIALVMIAPLACIVIVSILSGRRAASRRVPLILYVFPIAVILLVFTMLLRSY